MDLRGQLVGSGAAAGEVDFRVARRRVIADWRRGKVARNDVCDAHTELMRAARNMGRATRRICPICEDCTVVEVSYGFGKRMPPGGKLIETDAEIARLDKSATEIACYTVEVCPACGWNHLTRLRPLGGRSATVSG